EVDDGITELEEAVRLLPTSAVFHDRLGVALQARGDLDRAAAAFREAIKLDPLFAEAHCDLGHVLQAQGEFTRSLAAFRKGHELGSKSPDWSRPSAQWVRQAERWVEIEEQLPAVLDGRGERAKASQWLEFAWGWKRKQRFAASVRFLKDAFTAQPRLEEDLRGGYRYSAAGAAALAAAGKGADARDLGADERAELRKQAVAWLQADLKSWA